MISLWDEGNTTKLEDLPELVIQNYGDHSGVISSTVESLAHTPIVFEDRTYMRTLSLAGTQTTGTMTWGQIQRLRQLGSVVGAKYVLHYGDETFTVRFNHENPPVVSGVAVHENKIPEDGDRWHTIKVELMVI